MGTLVLLAFAAASAAPPTRDPELPYSLFRLRNGLTLIVHEDHSTPIATVNTWYHVGSARERPGRTGFAHLFEHIMFEGSQHVPEGAFDRWLEAAGGSNNGSTDPDRTNYFEDVPAGAVELALFLEADRMGFLLEALTQSKLDSQREVVKNERREAVENQPYGSADIALAEALYPPDHPYHWPTIGSMADLDAASREDVLEFFRRWYGPGNASIVVAGDVDAREVLAMAERWFGELPPSAPVPPPAAAPVVLAAEKRVVLEDRVELPRLYVAWPTPPAAAAAGPALDGAAAVLAEGRSSRLHRRLVYEMEAAQDVSVLVQPGALGSQLVLMLTARAGRRLPELLAVLDEEVARLAEAGPTEAELERFQNQAEAAVYRRLERVGGFGGKADQLNEYWFYTGTPDYLREDLARRRALSPDDVQAAVRRFLGPGRVVLSVVPRGRRELAAAEAGS